MAIRYPRRFVACSVVMVAVCVVAATLLALHHGGQMFGDGKYVDLLALCALAVIAEILAVDSGERVSFTASNLPILWP